MSYAWVTSMGVWADYKLYWIVWFNFFAVCSVEADYELVLIVFIVFLFVCVEADYKLMVNFVLISYVVITDATWKVSVQTLPRKLLPENQDQE